MLIPFIVQKLYIEKVQSVTGAWFLLGDAPGIGFGHRKTQKNTPLVVSELCPWTKFKRQ
jgi:hypothetical protein